MIMIDNKNHLPNHLAIIMDGNGRWAEQKGKKSCLLYTSDAADE